MKFRAFYPTKRQPKVSWACGPRLEASRATLRNRSENSEFLCQVDCERTLKPISARGSLGRIAGEGLWRVGALDGWRGDDFGAWVVWNAPVWRISARESSGTLPFRGFWRVSRLERSRLEDFGAKILFPAPVWRILLKKSDGLARTRTTYVKRPVRGCCARSGRFDVLNTARTGSFNRVGNAPRVRRRNRLPPRSTRGALPTRLNDSVGVESGLSLTSQRSLSWRQIHCRGN